jgi:hypothetical protein
VSHQAAAQRLHLPNVLVLVEIAGGRPQFSLAS